MKRLFSILSLLIFGGLLAQTPSLPIYKVNNLSISAPVKGNNSDSLLVRRGSDNLVRVLPVSELKINGFVSPQNYGAKGDGATDDTAAVQQCFNENKNILLYGTYLITGIIDIKSDQNIYANGCVMVKTSTTEPILRANNKDTWTIDGRLQLLGSGKVEGTASGLTIMGGIQYSVRGVTAQNFSGSGLMFINGTSTHRGDRGMISDCFTLKNWRGIYIGESMQYLSFVNLNSRENNLGAEIRGGNITITGGNIVDNDNGTYIGGTTGNNNSHGIFNGVNLNHNDYTGGYNIRLENAEFGQTFTSCHIYGETKSIEILNSKAASFVNCIIDGKIDLQDATDTGNKHYFSHCQLEPLVNVSGSYSDNLVFKTCFNRNGSLSELNSYDNVITGLNTDYQSGYDDLGNFSVLTTDSPAINKGGSISLGGNFYIDGSSNKQKATFAEIAGRKKNASNGDISGYMQFRVSNNSIDPYLAEVGRWLDNGNLIVNGEVTIQEPTLPTSAASRGYVDALSGKSGSFSGAGTATTTFTVSIGATQPNNTYKVNATPTNALSAAVFYITNKTTTTFDVVYVAGLTGTVAFDWSLRP